MTFSLIMTAEVSGQLSSIDPRLFANLEKSRPLRRALIFITDLERRFQHSPRLPSIFIRTNYIKLKCELFCQEILED
jgi:hypothetical protein